MKIVETEFVRELAVSRAVILWNYWDHEHLYVVHKNYDSAYVLYDDEKMAFFLLTYKLPIFSFLTSQSLNVMVQKDENTIKAFNMGLFGIQTCTTITVEEIRKDHCKITMSYKFILRGWRELLAPFLPGMAAKWNLQVWHEDVPLKIRRQKVVRWGFKDFQGLPDKVLDRKFLDDIPFELPIKRHKKSPINLSL